MTNEIPEAFMWTVLFERHSRRSVLSWPSLCVEKDAAITEAESAFGGKVISVRGKEPLFYREDKDESSTGRD